MSMIIDLNKNELVFVIPNSEAPIKAQHKGIVDRSVGSFYMSDNYEQCLEFLNGFNGDFYFDIHLTLKNANRYLQILVDNDLASAFKNNLNPQFSSISALEWYMKSESLSYYKIDPPTVNSNKKYLKLNNEDYVYSLLKNFLLGDLTKLVIKKIGSNGFMLYVDTIDDFDQKIKNKIVDGWKKSEVF